MTKRAKKIFLSVGAVLLVLCVAVASVGRVGNRFQLLSWMHLPIGRVAGDWVFASDLPKTEADALDYSKWLTTRILQLQALAKHYGVALSQSDIDWAFAYRPASATEGDISTDRLYQALEGSLRTFYSSQATSYETALASRVNNLESKVASGARLADLSEQFSDDTATKWFFGDTGYLDMSEMLPEYARGLGNIAIGGRGKIYSRQGIHFVEVLERVENKGKAYVRLRDITLVPQGFDAWLAKELATVPVTWFAKPQ